jgi:hypothetical protein
VATSSTPGKTCSDVVKVGDKDEKIERVEVSVMLCEGSEANGPQISLAPVFFLTPRRMDLVRRTFNGVHLCVSRCSVQSIWRKEGKKREEDISRIYPFFENKKEGATKARQSTPAFMILFVFFLSGG